MVTSLKMSENKMDNRGSKSKILNSMVVKEQRVDGSCHKRNPLGIKMYSNGFRKKLSNQSPF